MKKRYELAKLLLLAAIAVSLCLVVSPIFGIVYVNHDSAGAQDGAGWQTAYHTIQAGIDAASSAGGGEVWVATGTYTGAVTLKQSVHVYGGFSGNESSRGQRNFALNRPVISGGTREQTAAAVTGADSATVDGFAIEFGAVGVYCAAGSTTIANNIIRSCWIGIECQDCAPIISGNTFAQNTYDNILCFKGAPVVTSNKITGGATGILCCYSSPAIAGNVISGSQTGIKCEDSSPSTSNNNIIACTDAVSFFNSAPTITNNIIASNAYGIAKPWLLGPTLSRNDLFANQSKYDGVTYSGTGDISLDPRFTDGPNADYHLLPDSPCIEAGVSSAPGIPAVDIDGEARTNGAAVDIGADEYWMYPFNLAQLKKGPVPASVKGNGAVVTAVWPLFFYVETPNRLAGIRVNKVSHGMSLGAKVDLVGNLLTNEDGELCINPTALARSLPPDNTGTIDPLGCNERLLGGGGLWQTRMVTGNPDPQWQQLSGLNNVGTLVRIWGRVTQIDRGGMYFYLDDGSGMGDGTLTETAPGVYDRSIGVRVSYSPVGYSKGDSLMITGISSCFKVDGKPVRLILPRVGEIVKLR